MKNTIDVLYVEDNEDYVEFVGQAVKQINSNLVCHYVTDGKDAIEYFDNIESKKDAARLILLDLNLPGANGIEILKKIRSTKEFNHTPVIMFSTSDNPEDVKKSYDNGANAYLVKPFGLNPLSKTLKTVCDFWLSLNHSCN